MIGCYDLEEAYVWPESIEPCHKLSGCQPLNKWGHDHVTNWSRDGSRGATYEQSPTAKTNTFAGVNCWSKNELSRSQPQKQMLLIISHIVNWAEANSWSKNVAGTTKFHFILLFKRRVQLLEHHPKPQLMKFFPSSDDFPEQISSWYFKIDTIFPIKWGDIGIFMGTNVPKSLLEWSNASRMMRTLRKTSTLVGGGHGWGALNVAWQEKRSWGDKCAGIKEGASTSKKTCKRTVECWAGPTSIKG